MDLNVSNQPTFNALYFRNPKIQKHVQFDKHFIELLNREGFVNASKKYNVVMDLKNGMTCAVACTDIIQKRDGIHPAGMFTREFYPEKQSNYIFDERLVPILDKFNIFKQLSFVSDAAKRSLMCTDRPGELSDLLSTLSENMPNVHFLVDVTPTKRVGFKKVPGKPIIIACTKIEADNQPIGYYVRDVRCSDLYNSKNFLEVFNVLKKNFYNIDFKNEDVKKAFLENSKFRDHMGFLIGSYDEMSECLKKYHVLIELVDTSRFRYRVCSNIVQNKNNISASGIYSDSFTYDFGSGSCTKGISKGQMYLDNLNTAMNTNYYRESFVQNNDNSVSEEKYLFE